MFISVFNGLYLRKKRNLIEIGWERGMSHDQVSVSDMMAVFSDSLNQKHLLQSCILNACSPATDTELGGCGELRNEGPAKGSRMLWAGHCKLDLTSIALPSAF